MVLLVAVALAGAGLVVYTLESQRLERAVTNQVNQEVAEFDAFHRDVVASGETVRSPQDLIEQSLLRQAPAANELLLALTEGSPALVQPGVGVHADFQNQQLEPDLLEPAFVAAVVGADPDGESFRLDSPRYGPALVAVKPVRSSGAAPDSELAIVYFLRGERAELVETMETYAIVAAVALVFVSASAHGIGGRLLRPVRELQEAAAAISSTDLSRRIEARGNDDLTELTHTVNAMLERLEEAFAGQRQFLDDAGHELRTPITIVRGHLELLDPDDPDEVAQTVALVTDEVDRMSRLVDDLILLAKTRRPDFLRPEETDLEELTTATHELMRALADRSWSVEEWAEGTVWLDRQRIIQALLQLAANAVRFTEPTDTIAVGSRFEGGELLLWVRDTGAGIAFEHQQLIFDRFYQVDGEHGGGGLGLSIVHAIASAHRGAVGVRSVLGDGATFTLVLPVRQPQWSHR